MVIVDDLEMIYVEERQDERLRRSAGSVDLAFQLQEADVAEIGTGQVIERGLFSVLGGGASVGRCGVAIAFGEFAFSEP